MNNAVYLHVFKLLPEFGPKRLMLVANHFPSFEEAFHGTTSEFVEAGLELPLAQKAAAHIRTVDLANEQTKLEQYGINLLSYQDDNYPNLLKEIPTLPPLLYYRGTLGDPDELALAVVGTRKITTYGKLATPRILEPLVATGITIVSGLAYGIDALAHETAVKANKRTIAVLGCGIDDATLYPKNHQLLASQILETGGLILSEHPPLTPAFKQNFIARNRIIAGLCAGTLVIECPQKSGSLITAFAALDQNRSVFAVPGNIASDTSAGPHQLIKMGAKLVTDARDILEELNLEHTASEAVAVSIEPQTPEEALILNCLTQEPTHINLIIQSTSLPAGTVTAAITMLEMRGAVRSLGAQMYSLH